MASYVETKILDALFARLAALTFSPVIPIAWPNSNFSPPTNHIWLRVSEIPASSTPFDVKGGTTDRIGLMQIDVFRPLGEGHVTAKETAGKVAAHFPVALRLYSEGVKVVITRSEIGPIIKEDVRIMLPVTVRWRAFV